MSKYKTYDEIPQDIFDGAILNLAIDAGAAQICMIPGVWEIVAEHFNNDALDALMDEEE